MSVRRRTWRTKSGEHREAWVVAYADQSGVRRIATFPRKRDADQYHTQVKTEVRAGTHTAPSMSPTVAEAATDWLAYVELEGREQSTIVTYEQQVRLHLNPRLGDVKLAHLTAPGVHAFRDELLETLSRAMTKKVLGTLRSVLADAQRRGNVAQNVARGVIVSIDKRGTKLKAGVDIPTPAEIRRILSVVTGRKRAQLVVAIFAGLRASELRGLRWGDVDLKRGELRVVQRADRYGKIGAPKSAAGERTIPLGPMVVNTLREWRLACPTGSLVFPTREGRTEHYVSLLRAVRSVLIQACVTDARGRAKYGPHSFRHFYASWCINRKADGGLELPAKVVQERLGHSSIVMTLDTYGHLFPRGDDGSELAAAEHALFA